MTKKNYSILWKNAKNYILGGNMLLSKRPEMFLPDLWPTYFSKAQKINVWDLNGKKYKEAYFEKFLGVWCHGDWAKITKRGTIVIYGRSDATLNPGGVRIGTAEIEDAINTNDKVIESAVVGFPHSIKGQGIFAFVISSERDNVNYNEEIRAQVSKVIGPIAKPDRILLVDGLPKTRSGKIMRRILRKIASGEFSKIGDTSTLINPAIVDHIHSIYSKQK